jgi:hypothetical protein
LLPNRLITNPPFVTKSPIVTSHLLLPAASAFCFAAASCCQVASAFCHAAAFCHTPTNGPLQLFSMQLIRSGELLQWHQELFTSSFE